MATINLGNIKFNWQGAYNGATAYAVDDVVSYNGSSYICKLASTGNLPTNTTYFDQMSSAGTNGTDLTSTLTTQGDLVYRDGSGLQRLGAGTAGQVLQTGGAGANPSWGTLSSDFVHINTYTVSGNPTTWSINNFVNNSVYGHYKIFLRNVSCNGSNGNWIDFRLIKASNGVDYTGSDYRFVVDRAQYNTSDAGGTSMQGNYNFAYWRLLQPSSTVARQFFAEIDLYPEYLSGLQQYPRAHWQLQSYDGDVTWYVGQAWGQLLATENMSGFSLFGESGGQFVQGEAVVYGFKY
jgi:hypothetical protein